MELTNLSVIKSLLVKHGISAKKSFGQNFLLNEEVISRILRVANLMKEDNVLEIGPGLGVLTYELAKRVKNLTSVELDMTIVPVLKEVMKDFPNFNLVQKNILKYKPEYKNYKIVANIPYNITGQIFRYFLENVETKPNSLTLMIQKEVANKIVQSKGKHNLLSLSCQVFSKPYIVCDVPRDNFFPVPKVDSAVIHLDLLKKPLIPNTKKFFKLINQAFRMKRKMLKKSLNLNSDFLEKLNINSKARPQELSLEDWSNILARLDN